MEEQVMLDFCPNCGACIGEKDSYDGSDGCGNCAETITNPIQGIFTRAEADRLAAAGN